MLPSIFIIVFGMIGYILCPLPTPEEAVASNNPPLVPVPHQQPPENPATIHKQSETAPVSSLHEGNAGDHSNSQISDTVTTTAAKEGEGSADHPPLPKSTSTDDKTSHHESVVAEKPWHKAVEKMKKNPNLSSKSLNQLQSNSWLGGDWWTSSARLFLKEKVGNSPLREPLLKFKDAASEFGADLGNYVQHIGRTISKTETEHSSDETGRKLLASSGKVLSSLNDIGEKTTEYLLPNSLQAMKKLNTASAETASAVYQDLRNMSNAVFSKSESKNAEEDKLKGNDKQVKDEHGSLQNEEHRKGLDEHGKAVQSHEQSHNEVLRTQTEHHTSAVTDETKVQRADQQSQKESVKSSQTPPPEEGSIWGTLFRWIPLLNTIFK